MLDCNCVVKESPFKYTVGPLHLMNQVHICVCVHVCTVCWKYSLLYHDYSAIYFWLTVTGPLKHCIQMGISLLKISPCKMKHQSSFTYPHVVSNSYDSFISRTQMRTFEKHFACFYIKQELKLSSFKKDSIKWVYVNNALYSKSSEVI